jgi:hypothetical protein
VSRCPDDGQFYFVAALLIAQFTRSPPGSEKAALFSEHGIVADPSRSLNLGRRIPAEGLLRAFLFETGKPIKYGASIGQSLQTLRFLGAGDEGVRNAALDALQKGEGPLHAAPWGLWTKCASVFADDFLTNWMQRREPLAFLLYDPPPSQGIGSPVFIHSYKSLRLLARFREGQFVAGHKHTVEAEERIAELQRVWRAYRVRTINPPTKAEFDELWEGQNGVRGQFVMHEVAELPKRVSCKVYGRALEWGSPMGVGYRYLSLPQSVLLLRAAVVHPEVGNAYLRAI